MPFQSLGRDSVCSYLNHRVSFCYSSGVSIPRSGFCLFIRTRRASPSARSPCFNPSVGILFVHTITARIERSATADVSIPRSGFCLFIPARIWTRTGTWATFQSLGRDSVCSYQCGDPGQRAARAGFNPSVGILFVHTAPSLNWSDKSEQFQSLGRDSVCSYSEGFLHKKKKLVFQSLGRDSVCSYEKRPLTHTPMGFVSIPRSGFCLFIPGQQIEQRPALYVSIPRSGFCLFILAQPVVRVGDMEGFNPSVGILFVHTPPTKEKGPEWLEFQSLGRDSVCSYSRHRRCGPHPETVSIPRSGFCLFILAVNQSRA